MLSSGLTPLFGQATVAQVSRTQADVFDFVFQAFLVLGTIVGVVVVSYILYNAYKYRADAPVEEGDYDIKEENIEDDGKKVARPKLGQVPSEADGSSGGKVFKSFAISAVIVLGLVIFAYWNLLYVEGITASGGESGALADDDVEPLEIQVTGQQFYWEYTYPNGTTTESGDGPNEGLVVPKDRTIVLNITSCHPDECDGDVWHNWGTPEFRARGDALPGDYTQTWFKPEKTGSYQVVCYELCGSGHSSMRGEDIKVKSEAEFRDWCTDNNCMEEERLDTWLNQTGGNNE